MSDPCEEEVDVVADRGEDDVVPIAGADDFPALKP